MPAHIDSRLVRVATLFNPAAENTKWKLLGVHAMPLGVSDRDPEQDEKLGLIMTWYASLILEMTESAVAVES